MLSLVAFKLEAMEARRSKNQATSLPWVMAAVKFCFSVMVESFVFQGSGDIEMRVKWGAQVEVRVHVFDEDLLGFGHISRDVFDVHVGHENIRLTLCFKMDMKTPLVDLDGKVHAQTFVATNLLFSLFSRVRYTREVGVQNLEMKLVALSPAAAVRVAEQEQSLSRLAKVFISSLLHCWKTSLLGQLQWKWKVIPVTEGAPATPW
ncbi:hypothetical protein V6N12_050067 [Hibiscus sabdariffa]|uniref:Uncharacterized protein n=1 Tax=Hibiscus sabdariffa TaxID=183260 RepID=A0ABR2GCI7_9ROSI